MKYLSTTAPWPIPVGWSYIFEDMHGIERSVGQWRLLVSEDEGWVWWLCPEGSNLSIARGEADDMLGAIWGAFDALARQIDPTDTANDPPRFDPARGIAEALSRAGITRQKNQAAIVGETASHWNRHLKGRSPQSSKVQIWLDRAYSLGYPITLTATGSATAIGNEGMNGHGTEVDQPGMRTAIAALEKAHGSDGEILHHIGQAMTDLAWMLRTLKDPQADALLDVARAFEERHR